MDVGRHLPEGTGPFCWKQILISQHPICVCHLFVRRDNLVCFLKIVLKYLVGCCSIARFSLSNGHRRPFSHRALFTNIKNSQWCSTPALVQAYCWQHEHEKSSDYHKYIEGVNASTCCQMPVLSYILAFVLMEIFFCFSVRLVEEQMNWTFTSNPCY